MARKTQPGKIIPLDSARGKKENITPELARQRIKGMRPDATETHLLPVKFPYPDDPATMLANIPRHALGLEYALAMRERFPESCFLDDGHRSCVIGRIDFEEPAESSDRVRSLVHSHPDGPGYPYLKAQITSGRGTVIVEIANIISDPFGYDVFWHLIQQNPGAEFYTTEYDRFPISTIEHATLYELNFST